MHEQYFPVVRVNEILKCDDLNESRLRCTECPVVCAVCNNLQSEIHPRAV